MAGSQQSEIASQGAKTVVSAILGWLVPGLGHIYLGHRVRGVILLVTISATFWGGVAVGGVKTTVQPNERTAWFVAQICTGANCLADLAWAKTIPNPGPGEYSEYVVHAPSEDIAVVYTGVAGLLNILAIFDALSRGTASAGSGAFAVASTARSKG